MKRFLPLFLSLVVGLAPIHAELIVADKQRALPITIHPEASELTRSAAQDLARIITGMTGTQPTITESAEPAGIVIGTAKEFNRFQDDPALEIRDLFDGREAYLIRPDEASQTLWIIGNQDAGASHGVYSLLREHGYRALFPGETWEVIPPREKIAVSKPSQGRPKVLTRSIWAGFGSFDKQQGEDVDKWRRRNRLGASITGQIGHSWESMIRHSKAEFEANPHLHGLKADGSINHNSLRHGTQPVVEFTIDWFKRRLADPKARQYDILSLAPTDGDNYTRDPETQALGPIHESFYWYVNEVAKAMKTIAPDRLIGTTAYYLHAKPPSFVLEPNVIVLGATMFGSGGMTLEEFFTEWSKKVRHLGVRDYIYSGYQFHGDHPNGGMRRSVLARQANWLQNFPINYYSAEGLWEWGLKGISYYTLAQLLWDPSQSVDSIISDFCQTAYGAGSQAMEEYYKAMEPTGNAVRKHQIARGIEAITQAASKTTGDPASLARIDELKAFLVHSAWMDQMRSLKPSDPKRLELAAQDLEWNYRLRRSYILNYNCNRRLWMVNRQQLGNYLKRDRNIFHPPDEAKPTTPEEQNEVIAKVFGPVWEMRGGMIVPTEEASTALLPPKAEEIRKKFDEIVIPQYPPVEVDEVSYSTDYVPVDLGLEPEEIEEQALSFGANPRLIVWRAQSDEIPWRVTPNIRYRDRIGKNPLEITVESPEGEMTEPVTLKQDSLPKEVTLSVPGPGINEIFVHSKRMGAMVEGKRWEYMALPTDENTILFLNAPNRDTGKTAQPVYFYVPKGVTEIQAYTDLPGRIAKNSRFSPIGGDDVAPEIRGELLAFSVPQGHDGKVWRVEGGVGVRFYFLNLPNLFFLHPGKILLPQELVEKDKLPLGG